MHITLVYLFVVFIILYINVVFKVVGGIVFMLADIVFFICSLFTSPSNENTANIQTVLSTDSISEEEKKTSYQSK